jgi:hypothetical protein
MAVSHMRANLATGAREHTLSRLLIPSIVGGRVFLLAANNLDVSMVEDFRYAGKYTRDGDGFSPIDSVAEFISLWLGECEGQVLLENPFVKSFDQRVRTLRSPLRFLGPEVYHHCFRSNPEMISTSIEECCVAPFFTGVCSKYATAPVGCDIDTVYLERVVAELALVFTIVLDGEGFLFWEP